MIFSDPSDLDRRQTRLVPSMSLRLYDVASRIDFEITPDQTPSCVGNVSDYEWEMLRSLNLLSPLEIGRLQSYAERGLCW